VCNILKIDDYGLTIKICDYIKNSWTDLEPTEKQVDNIINFSVRLKLNINKLWE